MENVLYGRHIEVTIRGTDGKNKTFTSLPDNSERFSIEFDVKFEEKAVSTIKLYNILTSTIDLCKASKKDFANVQLIAGYEGFINPICTGKIIDYIIRQTGSNKILELKIANISLTKIASNFVKTKASKILENLLDNAGIKYNFQITYDPEIEQIALTGNVMTAVDIICNLISADYYYKENDILNIVSISKNPTEQIIFLDRTSGLIGHPEFNAKIKGYKVKSLLNGKIQKGNLVELKFNELSNNEVKQIKAKVKTGRHIGSSFSANYYTEFDCEKV